MAEGGISFHASNIRQRIIYASADLSVTAFYLNYSFSYTGQMITTDDIRALMDHLGLKQVPFAGELGVGQSTVSRWLNGATPDPEQEILVRELAERSGFSLPGGNFRPPRPFLGQKDLPVYSSVEGGPGEIHFGADLLDPVPRPWYVANSPDAYAVLVVGESMAPVIKPGQMVVVDPRMGLLPHEPAIFTSGEEGAFRATVKEFRRATAESWLVHQYNPPEGQEHDFPLPKSKWPKAVRVVGWFAGR
jgi:transcriptional regulator with XRE-family HTH domain